MAVRHARTPPLVLVVQQSGRFFLMRLPNLLQIDGMFDRKWPLLRTGAGILFSVAATLLSQICRHFFDDDLVGRATFFVGVYRCVVGRANTSRRHISTCLTSLQVSAIVRCG